MGPDEIAGVVAKLVEKLPAEWGLLGMIAYLIYRHRPASPQLSPPPDTFRESVRTDIAVMRSEIDHLKREVAHLRREDP